MASVWMANPQHDYTRVLYTVYIIIESHAPWHLNSKLVYSSCTKVVRIASEISIRCFDA